MVRMPRAVIVAVTFCLFLAVLYGLRQYGALGSPEHALLAGAAGVACAAMIISLIWANYETYPTPNRPRKGHHVNGACQ